MHVFTDKKKVREKDLWGEYIFEKQTYGQLANRYSVTKRTIQNRLDKICFPKRKVTPGRAVLIMDTSYLRRDLGVMVFRDHNQKKNVSWAYVRHERLSDYRGGIQYLQAQGWKIEGIVCDGKRGLFTAFSGIPVQMCQFHQSAIVLRYITKKPRLAASKELKEIVLRLTKTDKESFTEWLDRWYKRWNEFLSQRTVALEISRWHYTHKRLRSAYRSLRTNLPYLFSWYDYPDLHIPNTTNSLEGIFSDLKNKLRMHAGLKLHRKMKFINYFLSHK